MISPLHRRVSAPLAGWRAALALLLLVLMPLGLLRQSSTGGCRHQADAAAAGAPAASGGGDGGSALTSLAGRSPHVVAATHDHQGQGSPAADPAPANCGPAMLVARSASSGAAPTAGKGAPAAAVSPAWRAAPPPTPPPRLS